MIMKQKRTLKGTLTGLGTSFLSFLGISCGVCAGTCSVVVATPLATLLGISAASMANWLTQLLPVFTALSAIAFTAAYFSLYTKNVENNKGNGSKKPWLIPFFWGGLLLTVGIYTYTIAGNISTAHCKKQCHNQTECHASCIDKNQTNSCNTQKTDKQ